MSSSISFEMFTRDVLKRTLAIKFSF